MIDKHLSCARRVQSKHCGRPRKDLRQPIRLLVDCPYAIGRVAMKARGPTIKSAASTSSPFRALVREITRDIPAKKSEIETKATAWL